MRVVSFQTAGAFMALGMLVLFVSPKSVGDPMAVMGMVAFAGAIIGGQIALGSKKP